MLESCKKYDISQPLAIIIIYVAILVFILSSTMTSIIMSYYELDGNMPIHITSAWILKGVSATLQSYKYTLSYPEGGGISILRKDVRLILGWSLHRSGSGLGLSAVWLIRGQQRWGLNTQTCLHDTPGAVIWPRIQWKRQKSWLYIHVLGSFGYENTRGRLLKS